MQNQNGERGGRPRERAASLNGRYSFRLSLTFPNYGGDPNVGG